MPTIAQSSNFDRSQLGPRVQPSSSAPAPGPSSVVPSNNTLRSPFMHCSMPVLASTYDSLARQFYGNDRIPITRILPVVE
jgi:hypothetical protein